MSDTAYRAFVTDEQRNSEVSAFIEKNSEELNRQYGALASHAIDGQMSVDEATGDLLEEWRRLESRTCHGGAIARYIGAHGGSVGRARKTLSQLIVVHFKRGTERSLLDGAYESLKADMGPQKYAELLQTMEDTLREEGSVWVPSTVQSVEGMLTGGQFRWCLLNSAQGPLLAIYTSQEQLGKRKVTEDEVGIVIKIVACFDFLKNNAACAGFVINPQDDIGGVVVPRNVMEMIRDKASIPKGFPVVSFELVSDAVFALWGNAVNVPVPVMTVNEEVEALGGMDLLVNPIVENWEKRIGEGRTKGWSAEHLVRQVMVNAYDDSIAAGVMVHVDKSIFDSKSPSEWVRYQIVEEDEDEIEDVLIRELGLKQGPFNDYRTWEDSRRQNIDKYLEILEAKVGLAFKCDSKDQVYEIMTANLGMVVMGMVMFGIGYGAAVYAESRGPEEVKRVTEKQRRFLEEGYEAVHGA